MSDGGWFGGDEVPSVFWPKERKWYWAKDRAIQRIVGTGMFLADFENGWTFWINGESYPVELFDFAAATVPQSLDKTHG